MVRRWLVVIGLIVMAMGVGAQDVTQDMLIALNTARGAVGAPPLVANVALVAAAQEHSDDMAAGDFLSHTGSDGSQFWERMRGNGYVLVTGAENVLYRWDADVQGAYQQWYDSEGHRANMLNPAYTEVGVAYTVAADGKHYFTMVLGAQVGGVIQPTAVVVQPSATAIPPTLRPSPTENPPTLLPPPTATGIPALMPTPTPIAVPLIVSPLPTNPPPTLALTTVAIEPTPDGPPPDLRLVWDDRSFTLINVTGALLDIQAVQFESENGVLATTDWQTPELSAPLWGVPADDCLQVWGLGAVTLAEKPADCTIRHAWISVAESRLFWRGVPQFTVTNRGRVVAVCPSTAGTCDVNLEGSPPPVVPPPVNAPVAGAHADNDADILLQYDGQSLTLLNVSGGAVNLNGLRLESERGTLAIDAWNNDFLSADLGAFPAGDCLQAWTLAVANPPKPDNCDTRHAWIALADSRVMWVNVAQFSVNQNGETLGVCAVAAGRCEVQLPE